MEAIVSFVVKTARWLRGKQTTYEHGDWWYEVFKNLRAFGDILSLGQTCTKLYKMMCLFRKNTSAKGGSLLDRCVITVDTALEIWPPSILKLSVPNNMGRDKRRRYATLGYRNARGNLHGPTITCVVDDSSRILENRADMPTSWIRSDRVHYAIFHHNVPRFPAFRLPFGHKELEESNYFLKEIEKTLHEMNQLQCRGGPVLFALEEQRHGYKYHSGKPFKIDVGVAFGWNIWIETLCVYPSYDAQHRIMVDTRVVYESVTISLLLGEPDLQTYKLRFASSVSSLEEIVDAVRLELYREILGPVTNDYGERLHRLLGMQLTTRQMKLLLRHEALNNHVKTFMPPLPQ